MRACPRTLGAESGGGGGVPAATIGSVVAAGVARFVAGGHGKDISLEMNKFLIYSCILKMSKQAVDLPINFPKRADGNLDFTNFYKPLAGGKYWFQLISDFEKKQPAWIIIINNSLIDYYKTLKQNNKSVYHNVDYLRYLKAVTNFIFKTIVAHPATQP